MFCDYKNSVTKPTNSVSRILIYMFYYECIDTDSPLVVCTLLRPVQISDITKQ